MPLTHLNHKRIHYTDHHPQHGASARETFVLMHGLGSSQNYYGAIVPRLLDHNFRCITFDTTGSGRSPYTHVEQSVQSLADDIITLMDALGVDKAVVVGHSMGGIVAPHLAATRSDRVVAAILIGPVYPSASMTPVFEGRIEAVDKDGMDAMANTIPSSAVATTAPPLVRAFIRELLLAQDPAGYKSLCRVIAYAHRSPPAYAQISIPVLVIAGDEDKSAPLDGCRKIFDALGTQEKKMEVLRQCGHWHCLEKPEECAGAIVDFYGQIQ